MNFLFKSVVFPAALTTAFFYAIMYLASMAVA